VGELNSPPVDPRTDLPALGSLPRVAVLDELVTRVLAPNPSMMTLDGTNTYVVLAPGSTEAAIIDPGPDDAEHVSRVEAVLRAAGTTCAWILVTHHHVDHAEAARPWARRFGARVAAASIDVVAAASDAVSGPAGRVLAAGEYVEVGATRLQVVPTPGHCADHLAFRLENGAVLVGDHILGRGSSVVTYPEGDLLAYLDSLRRVHDLGPSTLYPGHGPQMSEDPSAVIDYYLAHRRFRERQILARLADGPADPAALVAHIYAAVDPRLWGAARQSTQAALRKLQAEDVIELDSSWTARLRP
jgi:glyoxylase-like metal-dependent hydrolase (beta-lactamase superfamily II)